MQLQILSDAIANMLEIICGLSARLTGIYVLATCVEKACAPELGELLFMAVDQCPTLGGWRAVKLEVNPAACERDCRVYFVFYAARRAPACSKRRSRADRISSAGLTPRRSLSRVRASYVSCDTRVPTTIGLTMPVGGRPIRGFAVVSVLFIFIPFHFHTFLVSRQWRSIIRVYRSFELRQQDFCEPSSCFVAPQATPAAFTHTYQDRGSRMHLSSVMLVCCRIYI